MADNPLGQGNKCNKAVMEQSSRWLAQEPYVWTGMGCTLVFFVLFAVSWVHATECPGRKQRLRTVADKHHVTTVMLNELYPELAVTVSKDEKLVDVVGVDCTGHIQPASQDSEREEEKQSKNNKKIK